MDRQHATTTWSLVAPTLADLKSALVKLLGSEQGAMVYREACGSTHVPDENDAPVECVASVADMVAAREGLASIVGLTIKIRCETYQALCAPRESLP